jgi:hypothetical protein
MSADDSLPLLSRRTPAHFSGSMNDIMDELEPLSDAQLQSTLGAELQGDLDAFMQLLPQLQAPAALQPAAAPPPPAPAPAPAPAADALSLALIQQVQQAQALQLLLGGKNGDHTALLLGLLSGSMLSPQSQHANQQQAPSR